MPVPRIFVSHSNADAAWCEQLAEALIGLGFDVWFDKQNLYVGDQWINKIEQQLESRDVFLIVLSPDSWASNWVRRELQLALHRNKRIMGVKHRQVDLQGFITTYQILDAVNQDAMQVASQVSMALGVAIGASLKEDALSKDAGYMRHSASDENSMSILRFQGVYDNYNVEGDYHAYLRFYKDGRVKQVSSNGSAAETARLGWFTYESKMGSRGDYQLIGPRLKFSCTSDYGVVDYEGTIQPNGDIELSSHSHINGHKAHKRYTFVPVNFGS